MIKYCQNCYDTKNKFCPSGYKYGLKEEVKICPLCNGKLTDINFSAIDLRDIMEISEDKSFIEAMIDLREKDIVEYNLKMSQFKAQLSQTKQAEESNIPKCPTCGSTKLSKVSVASKAGSVFMFGLLSQKVKKTWHCDNCKYEW